MTNEILTVHDHPPALTEAADIASQLRKHEGRIDEVVNGLVRIANRQNGTVEGLTEVLANFDAFSERELPMIRND